MQPFTIGSGDAAVDPSLLIETVETVLATSGNRSPEPVCNYLRDIVRALRIKNDELQATEERLSQQAANLDNDKAATEALVTDSSSLRRQIDSLASVGTGIRQATNDQAQRVLSTTLADSASTLNRKADAAAGKIEAVRQRLRQVPGQISLSMGACFDDTNRLVTQGFQDMPAMLASCSRIDQLEDQLGTCQQEVAGLTAELSATRLQLSRRKAVNRAKQVRIERLEADVNDAETRGEDAHRLASQLRDDIIDMTAQIERLEAAVSDAETRQQDANRLASRLEHDGLAKSSRIEQLEAAVSNAKAHEEDANRLASRLEHDSLVKTSRIEQLEAAMGVSEARLATANSHRTRLEQLLRATDIESSDASSRALQLSQELADAVARLADSTARVSQLESTLCGANDATAAATRQADDALRSSHTLVASLARAAQEIEQLKSAAANSQTVESMVDSLADAFTSKMESMAATSAAEAQSLRSQLQAKEREMTQLTQSNASLQRDVDQTTNANTVLKRSLDNISRDKRDAEARADALQAQIETAQRQLSPPASQARKRARLDSGNDTGGDSSSSDGSNIVSQYYTRLAGASRNLRFAQRVSEIRFDDIAIDLFHVLLEDGGAANIRDFMENGRMHEWSCYVDVAQLGTRCPVKPAGPCRHHDNACLRLRVVIKDGQRQLEFYEEDQQQEEGGRGGGGGDSIARSL
ncbi:hypothetical protein MAC_02010 [Metarhizium acridum CQMa 102]|uniref:Uncharacterized protein n=1 Tax=Metarhizium acridum (strain CQMa 102) TaxID=655827 RepID=E9DWL2_METAQ|nr:uncharacterized protein MAC_02010 [Metarhizium acridum CQMa 102]EFY92062.1 hypothetical protein MAC_02010 [Metarhizium acridum CQMa 102]